METEKLNFNQDQRYAISQNLSYLMKVRKTTENKVAQALNIPVMTIRRLLSGETTDPRVFTLKTIADYFNVTIDSLIGTGAMTPYEFVNHSKPIFVPILNWESAKKFDTLDLKNWQDWIPITIENTNYFSSTNLFAIESRPSMYPRFQQGTIFIFDIDSTPSDGDLVLVNLLENNDLTLRELSIDPPEWQLNPVNQNSPRLQYSKDNHKIVAVVFLTLFYNRKLR